MARSHDRRHWDRVQDRANREIKGEPEPAHAQKPKDYERDVRFVEHRARPDEHPPE